MLGTGVLSLDTVANEACENYFLGESVKVLTKDEEGAVGTSVSNLVDDEIVCLR